MAKKSTTLLIPIINSNEAKYVPEGAADPGQTHGHTMMPLFRHVLPAGEKVLLLLSVVTCEEKKEKIASCLFDMKKKIVYMYERFCS